MELNTITKPMNSIKQSCYKALQLINNTLIQAQSKNNTLFGGELCLAVYFLYMGEFEKNKRYNILAHEKLDSVLKGFNNEDAKIYGVSYTNGYAGLLYTLAIFIEKKAIDKRFCVETKHLAEILTRSAEQLLEEEHNDPIHGSFGIFHALMYYGMVSRDTKYANKVWKKIQKKYYEKESPWIPNFFSEKDSPLQVNFSFAHGQCGLLRILLEATDLFGLDDKTYRFFTKHIDFILSFKKEDCYDNTNSVFASTWDKETGVARASPRLAWCYGDLGHLILLTLAGKKLNKENYIQEAILLGRRVAGRKQEKETIIKDSYFCHGAAGVAQIFNLLYTQTGAKDYLTLHNHWIKRSIELFSVDIDPNKDHYYSLALGLPGVGLSFMSHLSQRKSSWSGLMLL